MIRTKMVNFMRRVIPNIMQLISLIDRKDNTTRSNKITIRRKSTKTKNNKKIVKEVKNIISQLKVKKSILLKMIQKRVRKTRIPRSQRSRLTLKRAVLFK
jgi:hypothetical protein